MKKYLIGFVAAITIMLLSSFTYRSLVNNHAVDVRTVNVDGHKYVVASSYATDPCRPGGVALVHAESCSCKR